MKGGMNCWQKQLALRVRGAVLAAMLLLILRSTAAAAVDPVAEAGPVSSAPTAANDGSAVPANPVDSAAGGADAALPLQGPASSDSAASKPATPPGPGKQVASIQAAGTHRFGVALDSDMRWQAQGGIARVNVTGVEDPSAVTVTACFRWKYRPPATAPSDEKCHPVPVIRALPQDGETLPATTIPFGIEVPLSWDVGRKKAGVDHVVAFVPASHLVVKVASADGVAETVLTLGITSRWISAILTMVFLLILGITLHGFANDIRLANVTFVLRLVAQGSGWASLGKLQILLWTIVVGGGAVFVITQTGTLIDISSGTLVLLGISGAAAVASQVKTKQETQSALPVAVPAINLTKPSAKLCDQGVLLSWFGPSLAQWKGAYVVQYQKDNQTDWTTVTATLSNSRLLLPDLDAGSYVFQVCAANTAGQAAFSPATEPVVVPAAPGRHAPLAGALTLAAEAGPESIVLQLPPATNGTSYSVQYRPVDSDRPWTTRKDRVTEAQFTVNGLESDTDYEFRIIARDTSGDGPPSESLCQRTGPRRPRWSDLVTQTTQAPEIDMSRLQMLIFTVVSAFFVALNIWKSGTIPAIDSSYLLLMGISNGVYVAAKFT